MKPSPAAILLVALAIAGWAADAAAGQDRQRRFLDGPVTREEVNRSLVILPPSAGDPGGPTEASLALAVEFEFDSAALTAAALRDLDEVAAALNDPLLVAARVTVEGHADAIGLASYNLQLSQQRAQAVVAYLVSRSVAGERLIAVGFGEDRLLREFPPDNARQRRVEFVRDVDGGRLTARRAPRQLR